MDHKKYRNGQTLIEVLIAIAIGVIMLAAAADLILPALRVNSQAGRTQISVQLAQQLLDNVRSWSEGDWHNITNLATSSANLFYLNTSSSPFVSAGGTETVTVATSTYTRYFYVDDVGRSSSTGGIVLSAGTNDPSTKKITVVAGWTQGATSSIIDYLTRSADQVYVQTDWSGGPGQSNAASTTNSLFATSTNINYTTSTGSIQLQTL